jgi:AraC-like DNA-binding protein
MAASLASLAAMTGGALPQTCGTAPPPVAWIRPGQLGYIGPDLEVDLHATPVAVLSIGLDAPFTLMTARHGATQCAARTRPPERPTVWSHPKVGSCCCSSIPPARPPAAWPPPCSGTPGPTASITGWRTSSSPRAATAATLTSCAHWPAPRSRHHRPTDQPAGRRRPSRPSRAFRAHETASRLGLSTSHFLRLFAQHTGTTFRRYQQWARLLHAVRGMVAGHDLTRCATDAGFASPSHFSDTFHRTFGLSPSALLSSRIQIDLDAIEP